MKRLQVLLVTLAGAAAAIPGVSVARQFSVPPGTGPLFDFVMTVVCAAVVLTAYVLRIELAKWCTVRTRFLGASMGLLLMILTLFLTHIWLTGRVLVEHDFDGTSSSQTIFFPLFLTDRQDSLISANGGRRRFIETPPYSPATVASFRTEGNVTFTIGTLLLSYTALVGSIAVLFALLGLSALSEPQSEALPDDP